MKILPRLAAGLGIGAAFFLAGCGLYVPSALPPDAAATFTVDAAKTVKLRIGETVAVRLGSNPTTGFGWEVDQKSLADVLALAGKPTYTPDPVPAGTVGSGGTETLVLLAKKSGTQVVNFFYRQPWEKKKKAGQVTLIVIVQ